MATKRVVMIAAEDGALPNGRVTSIGEMTRALPPALAGHGWATTVLSPGYGVHHRDGRARDAGALDVRFAGATHRVTVHKLAVTDSGADHLVFEHPLFSPQGPGQVYCQDEPSAPCATDASKFAFFCAACAAFVKQLTTPPDAVHVHDWHGALYFALRAYDESCLALRTIRSVYTIHSLAVQGRRPLTSTASSLRSWFPALSVPRQAVVDPHYADCANPTATALRLADAVSVGSPTFAKEIQRASSTKRGQCGGFGLHELLLETHRRGRLIGVLDGSDYPGATLRKPTWRSVTQALVEHNMRWIAQSRYLRSAHFIADRNLAALPRSKPALLLTGSGPLGDNEVALYRRAGGRNASVLEAIVGGLRGSERFILLGAGDPAHEQFFVDLAARFERFVFLCGPHRPLIERLQAIGDVHLLPHASAPGPGPALEALRVGQPCVAHAVGGLADVVRDNANGWLYRGRTPTAQARNFLQAVTTACVSRRAGGQVFGRHRRAAAATRHEWSTTARTLSTSLYTGN